MQRQRCGPSNLRRRFGFAKALKRRLPQDAALGPGAKLDFCDQVGPDPFYRRPALLRGNFGEWTLFLFQRFQSLPQIDQRFRIKPGPNAAGINKLSLLEIADQKRPDAAAIGRRKRKAANDELFAPQTFDLNPIAAAARDIRPVAAL